jgi:multiple sugar transport system permease protein
MKRTPRSWAIEIALLLPATILLLCFFILPAFCSLYYSLTDQMLVGQRPQEVSFIGFDNYVRGFQDPTLAMGLATTALILAAAVILQQGAGWAIAKLLEGKRRGFTHLVHACIYSGWLMPEVAVAFVFFLIFSVDGVANQGAQSLNLKSVAWLIDHPILVLVLAQLWNGTACSLVTFEHELASISGEMLDAARADGANSRQIFFLILVPSLKNAILTNTATVTLGNIGTFGLIYMLTGGGPLFRSTNLPVLVFRNSISGSDTGYGLALSFLLFCLCTAISMLQVRLVQKQEGDAAWV